MVKASEETKKWLSQRVGAVFALRKGEVLWGLPYWKVLPPKHVNETPVGLSSKTDTNMIMMENFNT